MNFKSIVLLAAAAALFAGAAQAGDAKKGEAVFQRCTICHASAKGAGNRIGPNLFGVAGRKAGTEANFAYSAAMKGAGFVWTPEKLTAYAEHPQQIVPGNRMAFAGITSPTDAQDLVAYLETLK